MGDILFTRSASRHGISHARIRYVLAHYVWAFEVGEDMTLYIGPDREGVDLEVGTAPGRTGGTYVVHAMKLRARFVAEYRSQLPWQG